MWLYLGSSQSEANAIDVNEALTDGFKASSSDLVTELRILVEMLVEYGRCSHSCLP